MKLRANEIAFSRRRSDARAAGAAETGVKTLVEQTRRPRTHREVRQPSSVSSATTQRGARRRVARRLLFRMEISRARTLPRAHLDQARDRSLLGGAAAGIPVGRLRKPSAPVGLGSHDVVRSPLPPGRGDFVRVAGDFNPRRARPRDDVSLRDDVPSAMQSGICTRQCWVPSVLVPRGLSPPILRPCRAHLKLTRRFAPRSLSAGRWAGETCGASVCSLGAANQTTAACASRELPHMPHAEDFASPETTQLEGPPLANLW